MKKIELTKSQMWTLALALGDVERHDLNWLKEHRVLRQDGERNKNKKGLSQSEEYFMAELKRIRLITKKLNKYIEILL